MTVKELIEHLTTQAGADPKLLTKRVIIATRGGCSPVPDEGWYNEGLYAPENTWSGEFYSSQEEADEVDDETPLEPCIVLYGTG